MTTEKAASTSSAAMEQSRQWTEITRLGARIVAQLDAEDSADMLSRWMSHHLAELLTRAEGGGEEDKERAAELILELWSHRGSWPQGWPPEATEGLRRALADPDPWPPRGRSRPENTLPECLAELAELQREEYEVWFRLALVDERLAEELDEVAELRDDLDDREIELLEPLTVQRRLALDHFSEHADGENEGAEAAARVELTRNELRRIGQRRGVLLRRALAVYLAGADG